MKERLDVLLVSNGYAESREKAKAIIMSGQVFIDGQREDKAGSMFDPDKVRIEVKGSTLKYVSRGGLKLEKAIAQFDLQLADQICMDIGASTGGFTDCMLQNGAAKVYAVDVGYGQLAWKLRSDERVVNMERTNVRYLEADSLGELVDAVTIDVAFISLDKVLPAIYKILKPEGFVVALIKPQFEAGAKFLTKKGVVKDKTIRAMIVYEISLMALEVGFDIIDVCFSGLEGESGNIEYLMYMIKRTKKNGITPTEVKFKILNGEK